MSLLKGRTAIVTGAGSGMGKAIAHLFAKQGANVTIADINDESAKTTADTAAHQRVQTIQADVASESDVDSLVSKTVAAYGGLDIVVNCAGVPQSFTSIEELTMEQWDAIMNVNSKSIFLMAKYAVPFMKKQKSGSIVNIASIAGIRARPGLNAYCASKGAAIMLTKALALELAPFQIRVNVINPGPANTPMIGQFLVGDETDKEEGMKRIFQDSVPLGMLIEPEDIAQGALYLASDLSKIVTGEILNIDGGRGI
ncbi:SDR family oxidoreductase [Siminovitchia fortis]|uniref:SDR family oxidoreductase n=1 Tax=Siminovitchia fortis TaxID=254758 RepID=A0A443IQM9_9BACI|nr:SDR family oxidoreductase [Siminovitchia fortis]RWR08613.1 SDR family oxidoreductase [Siminovitchia fortis]WHY83145.1 SDR family oxidoreductase [Siminovitchia fortis]